MGSMADRLNSIGSPANTTDNGMNELQKRISPPTAPMTMEATQPQDKEEEKDLTSVALSEPDFRDWYTKQQQIIDDKFDKKEQTIERARLVEMLSQAVTQFGAAMAAGKSGVDMSNLKFIKQDFEKQLDRIAGRRREAESGLRQELGARRRYSELIQAKRDREKERLEDRAFRAEESQRDRDLRTQELSRKEELANKPRTYLAQGDVVKVNPDYTVETIYKGRRTDLAERKQEHKEKEQDEPTPKQIEDLAGYAETTALLNKIKQAKTVEDIDTGPIADALNRAASMVGWDDPKMTTLRQDVVDTLAKKMHQISGAAVSEKEAKRLSFTLPQMSDNDEQFMAKLDNAIANIELAKQARIEALEKGGRDVQQFKSESSQDGKIKVKNKNGQIGYIPAEQLNDAIAQGYTKVD